MSVAVILPPFQGFEIYGGDDFAPTLTVTNPDGTPADLSGYSFLAHIKTSPSAPDVLGEWQLVVNGNVITMYLDHLLSASLPPWCVWDVEMVNIGGGTITLLTGTLSVKERVTR